MTMESTLFQSFCKERNLTPKSIIVYDHALQHYVNFNGMSLEELLNEAEKEEDDKIPLRKRKIIPRLIDFRNYLIENGYASSTKMVGRVRTFYNHYYIELPKLPHVSFKHIVEIKIPTKEELQKALELSDPLMESIILMLVSTGLSKIDLLKLKIKDFIKATSQYHNETDIYKVLEVLNQREDVIPTFELIRTKTQKFHYTFASPEAVISTVNYLLTRPDKLTMESSLFKISYDWLTVKFEKLNKKLGLGVTSGNEYVILRCHTLRKYHATTLRNDGLSIDIVNSFQGKAKNNVDSVYFIDSPEVLKKMYVEHVGCLAINMEIKELNIKSEEYLQLEKEVVEKEKIIEKYNGIFENIDERLSNLEKKEDIPLSEEEISDLFS